MSERGVSGEAEEPTRLLPLHGGRHSLPPDVVAFNQRERLLGAIAAAVAEHGYNKATIAQITSAAQVSRRTFYEHFADKEECFLAAYDAVDDYLASLLAEAVDDEAEWAGQVAATFATVVRFLADRPQLARLYLVEAAAVGEAMASRRERSAERFIVLLQGGRELTTGRDPGEGIEEALVGGIVTLLTRRIIGGEVEQLGRFVPGVVEFALAPYLGPDEARQVAAEHA